MALTKFHHYRVMLEGKEVCRGILTGMVDGETYLRVTSIADPEFRACGFRIGSEISFSLDRVSMFEIPVRVLDKCTVCGRVKVNGVCPDVSKQIGDS